MSRLEQIEVIEKPLLYQSDTLHVDLSYAGNEYFLQVMGPALLRHAYCRYLGVKDSIEAIYPNVMVGPCSNQRRLPAARRDLPAT
ncbi:MAG: hypothetical protein OXC41_06630 [Gammaproteobacteria bacterium]|nr:hypothetical protein [Gammaproteobacteria bacterium]